MKVIRIYQLFVIIFLPSFIFSQNQPYYPTYDSLKKEYQILSWRKNNKYYLINAMDSNTYKFTIIAVKSKKQKGSQIAVGKKYDLLLRSIYPPPEKDVILVGGNMIHHDFIVHGIRVKFQGNFDTGILVTTPNLKGLYYIPPE